MRIAKQTESVKLYRNGGGATEAFTILHQEKNDSEVVTEGEMSLHQRRPDRLPTSCVSRANPT